jgi:glycerate kinase
MAAGVLRAAPNAEVLSIPMADGGEGTVDAIVAATRGTHVTLDVTGPLGETVSARYGITGDASVAVIEMAAASGLELIPPDQRDPAIATTRGTGELLVHAIDSGAKRILIGLGGSATNDGGAGFAEALGYQLLDSDGQGLAPGGLALARLHRIDSSSVHQAVKELDIVGACDVTNPLCGPEGASAIFGPQKGASPTLVQQLDEALLHFGTVAGEQLGVDILTIPRAGAAGGLGGGLVAFAGASLRPGVEFVAETAGLEPAMENSTLVLTGEGRIDAQTALGKTPMGVSLCAARHGIPVIAIAGLLGDGWEALLDHGVSEIYDIRSIAQTAKESISAWRRLLEKQTETAVTRWMENKGIQD